MEPFFIDSHRSFAEGLQKHSSFNIQLVTLPGRHWKWRMYGSAITFSKEQLDSADLIIASDMVDVATFRGLNPQIKAPVVTYFHENQLTYPWSPTDQDIALKRDRHYAFTNYTSALAADAVWFNSEYNQNSFLGALLPFLQDFPDYKNLDTIEQIASKSAVMPLGLDLPTIDNSLKNKDFRNPTILWNHRWEYDKNPDEFFEALFELSEDHEFDLVVLGKSQKRQPPIFDEAKKKLKDRIVHWGWVDSKEDYWNLLSPCDLLPVTSYQEFFGISVIEAVHAGVVPLLPNRLAYPEYPIPSEHYYDGEMLPALKNMLAGKIPRSRIDVSQYSWDNRIAIFDKAFQSLHNQITQ
ncbi:MAG: DUF3524 domain-containing protein [Flavobacteriales bacterium]|nr:DUF3524 domain-containing protein [Flavobacteriales bacterium]